MGDRRSLVQGLAETPKASIQEHEFVYAGNESRTAATKPQPAKVVTRTPITTRLRDDYAREIKQISLRRQMDGIEPHTLQDILEQAVGAWLETNRDH